MPNLWNIINDEEAIIGGVTEDSMSGKGNSKVLFCQQGYEVDTFIMGD